MEVSPLLIQHPLCGQLSCLTPQPDPHVSTPMPHKKTACILQSQSRLVGNVAGLGLVSRCRPKGPVTNDCRPVNSLPVTVADRRWCLSMFSVSRSLPFWGSKRHGSFCCQDLRGSSAWNSTGVWSHRPPGVIGDLHTTRATQAPSSEASVCAIDARSAVDADPQRSSETRKRSLL